MYGEQRPPTTAVMDSRGATGNHHPMPGVMAPHRWGGPLTHVD